MKTNLQLCRRSFEKNLAPNFKGKRLSLRIAHFLLVLACLTVTVTSDCGFIKILDKIKEYDGENADVINGKFDSHLSAQYSIFGFMRIMGTEVKTYSMFKFDNNINQASGLYGRRLQDSFSGYDELLSISFSKYNNSGEEVNLLVMKKKLIKVNIANGSDSSSKLLIPIELKQWVSDWIFLGLSLDYASGNLFIFVKSFSSLGNEMKTLEKLNFGDFKLKPEYEIVMGGIEKQNYQNFKGVLFDWNLSTFYMGTITEFSYLLTGKSASFASNGVLFGTQFALSSKKFVTRGLYSTYIANSSELQTKINDGITIPDKETGIDQGTRLVWESSKKAKSEAKTFNPYSSQASTGATRQLSSGNLRLTKENKPYFSTFPSQGKLSKVISFTNSDEYIKEKVYGARFTFKDSMSMTGLLIGTNNTPQIEVITPGIEKPLDSSSSFYIKKFILYLNFSFKEIVGDELIIFSSTSPNSPNGFYISLVEKSKEDFFKQFFSDGIHVLPANFNFDTTYTYDSSQGKPKILKLHVIANNGKKLTFVSPIQIKPNTQYGITIGFYSYPPGIIRAFFQHENKFLFTHEEGDLDFVFSDQEFGILKGNDKSFGGYINLNELRILEAPHSFLQSGSVSTTYFNDCYPNCTLLGFDYSKNSIPFHSNNGDSNSTSCLQCKKDSSSNLMYHNKCVSFCPFSYFAITANNSCKQCSTLSCDLEIPRTVFTVASISSTRYTAKINNKIFFRKFDSKARRLQATDNEIMNYCNSRIKGLEKDIDYTIKMTSKFNFNILECTSEFEFFRSFRNKEIEFDLNPTLYSGNNAIIDESNNPVYVKTGLFNISKYQRSDSQSESLAAIFCALCILMYALTVAVCVIYALLKGDNFLKWIFLLVTHYIHIISFFISLDFELPINLRVFLLCLFNHLIKWLGGLRTSLTSGMASNPELKPFTSFNLLASEISPFLFVNLMSLLICFLLFYLCYGVLKVLEFYILHSFKDRSKTGQSFSKFQIFVLKFLRLIDIGVPLMGFLLFLVPVCVFSSLNLNFATSISQTLFTASTFFSVFFLLFSLAVIILMFFYIYYLYVHSKRYISSGVEHYCLNKFHNNMTLHHFPRKLRALNRTNKDDFYDARYGPYNLHLLNFINERNNDQINLEELYKHIIDEKERKSHSRNTHSISKKVPYNQVINENTEKNYLELLESPGWDGFNYRRPENINKLGLLYTNLSLKKPVFFHFFYSIYHFIIFLNCLFLGLGVLFPGVQVVCSLILHIILLVFFCFWKMYKHQLIFIFNVVLQSLFLLVLLGFFIIYVDFKRDLTNSVGRERMGLFTLVMTLFLFTTSLIVVVVWVVLRYCIPQNFKSSYFNRDFTDEEYLKYYKEIPQMVYKMGQKAESADENQNRTNTGTFLKSSKPNLTVRPQTYIGSSGNNSISIPKTTTKFDLQHSPEDTLKARHNSSPKIGMNVDQGDLVEKHMNYLSEENNEVNYNPKRSRAPHQFGETTRDRKIAKLTLKDIGETPMYNNANFNTTDRLGSHNVNMGTMGSGDDKKNDMQVKESVLFHSYDYVHQQPSKPVMDVINPISFEPKDIPDHMKVPKKDNYNFSPSGTYIINNDDQVRKAIHENHGNLETTQNINYSYSQFGVQGTRTPYNQIDTNRGMEESKPHMMEPDNDPNKPFFNNENFTKIMGQESKNEQNDKMNDDIIEPMNTIQLKHSHFVMKERFDKATDLK